jgi:mRNA interferase MazF
MVTNAQREDWADDVAIPNAEALGLLIPSKVRTAKLFTAEASTSTLIGHLEAEVWARVRDRVRRHLGF